MISAANIGLGKTRSEVLRIAESVASSKGILRKEHITSGWWRSFLRRNKKLSLRAGDATASTRMNAINKKNMRRYFKLLKSVYDEFDFQNSPERIYNMDETGVPLDPRPPKVVAEKGKKKVRYRCSGLKSQITVVGCGSATGQAIPPYIIYAAKQLSPLWMKDEVPGSCYAVSDNGWIDQELFHFWLKDHFLKHAVAARPLLLLLDGHSSHFKPETIRYAKENGVIVFCLPPHTTHECQPLDCSLFGPLKVHWRKLCHSFYQKHPNGVISKLNFCSLFKEAWLQAIIPETISAGFRQSGVYPFDQSCVLARNGLNNNDTGDISSSSSEDESNDSESDSNDDGDPDGNLANNPTSDGKSRDLNSPSEISQDSEDPPAGDSSVFALLCQEECGGCLTLNWRLCISGGMRKGMTCTILVTHHGLKGTTQMLYLLTGIL